MKRKKRMRITAYHEIGHYLMLKKFFKDFKINGTIEKVEVLPYIFGKKRGRVRVFLNFNIENASTEMTYGYISILIAGIISAKLFCNYSYDSSNLVQQDDYLRANYYANKLSKNMHEKSPNEILKECEKEVNSYLMTKKDVMNELSEILLKKRFLTNKDLIILDKEYSL